VNILDGYSYWRTRYWKTYRSFAFIPS